MLHEALNQCASQGNPNNQRMSIYKHKFPNHERGMRKREVERTGHVQNAQWDI